MKLKIFNSEEYPLKLDYFYYDKKRTKVIIVLKIRNKRVKHNCTIQEIFLEKQALINMSPIDLCVLGILANSTSLIKVNETPLARIIDGFHMIKIAPFLEIIGHEYTDGEEIILLKLIHLNKIIRISVSELYKNKNLVNALEYQDAISLGYSVSDSYDLSYEKIIQPQPIYDFGEILGNGIYLCLIMLSILMSCRLLDISIFKYTFKFRSEIIFLPIFIFLKNEIKIKYNSKKLNVIYLTIMASLIIFIGYFGIIIMLPYPENDSITKIFNSIYLKILPNSFLFVLSVYFGYIMSYLIENLSVEKFNLLNSKNAGIFKKLAVNFLDIQIFFIVSFIVAFLIEGNTYSVIHDIYSIITILICFIFINLKYIRNN